MARFNEKLLDKVMRERKPPMAQSELARQVGVSRQMVKLWLDGRAQPSLEHASAVAAVFGYSVDFFLTDDTPARATR